MRLRIAAALVGLGALGAPSGVAAAPTEPNSLTNALTAWHNCSACHWFLNPADIADEPSIAPMAWQGSMMGNSARDPVFWAGVALASQDAPGETEDCIRCHSPRAFLEGRGEAISIDELLPDDLGGVSCDLCHRMVDDGVTPPGNARYTIDDVAVDGVVPRRGPWTYVDGEPSPPHPWVQDVSHLSTSELCGTCHDVSTGRERVDDDGNGLGVPFNEQRTYSEWARSDFAVPGDDFRSCQSCHMPAVEDVPGCEMSALQGVQHSSGSRHDLVGANRHMIGILKEIYGSGGSGTVPDFYFDRAIERTEAFLPEAATLELQVPARVDVTAGIGELTVVVTNETGHKLPTGYSEGRVMWLEITAEYAGQILWSSGQWDAATGIEQDAQLRTYEGVAEAFVDGTQLHLLRNDHWIVDSRIPPRGMMPDLEVDPVGDRYALLPDGTWPNFDTATFTFAGQQVDDTTPEMDDELVVRARLLYLINTPEYIDTLEGDNMTNGAGADLANLFDLHGAPEPVVIAEVSDAVALVGLTPVAADDTTGAETAMDTSTTVASSTTGATPTTADSTSGTSTTMDGSDGTEGPGADDDDAGCSCRTTAPASWSFAPLLVLFARRRRR
ncbi:MAG: MYXO-CTERM sorting domain-containing protein [Myxococcota bacterium]